FLLCEFGNRIGRLSWFETLADESRKEHLLLNFPGAVKVCAYDFNHDNLPDLVVAVGQAREGIYLFLSDGKGGFTMDTVAAYPPTWGTMGVQVADFNGDGFMDLLVV